MVFNTKRIKNSKFAKKLISFGNSNSVAKVIVGFILYGIAFIPLYLFICVWYLVAPEGFWQKFAVVMLGCLVAGWFQIFLLILATVMFIAVLCNEV